MPKQITMLPIEIDIGNILFPTVFSINIEEIDGIKLTNPITKKNTVIRR